MPVFDFSKFGGILSPMQTYLYPIVIEPCEEGGFYASCPVLQGAHAEGETYAETLENLESIMKGILELERQSGTLESFKARTVLPAFQTTIPITL